MRKTVKRSLIFLATFAEAMLLLLPLQALAKTPVPAQAAFPPSAENGFVGLSLNTEPAPVTDTASLTKTIGGVAPEGDTECPPLPPSTPPNECNDNPCTHHIYLPLIQGIPFLLIDGRIKLMQDEPNVKGLTIFDKNGPITLDFSELQFSNSEKPRCIKWWSSGEEEQTVLYTDTVTVTPQVSIIGAQRIMIKFVNVIGAETPAQEFTFFYIPNGHFNDSGESETWNLFGNMNTDNGPKIVTPTTGSNKRLRLYVTDTSPYDSYPTKTDRCTEANIGFAAASIDLALPSTGAYHLFVDGTVYTQDQNPSNNATFDAFEILLNGHVVQRYSNKDQPIRCDPVINRQVVVDARIPLSGYSGITTLGLENHQRFDNQFATYTEINMVWIDY